MTNCVRTLCHPRDFKKRFNLFTYIPIKVKYVDVIKWKSSNGISPNDTVKNISRSVDLV